MNVIIPPKLRNKSSSFVKLVSYLTQRENKPSGNDILSETPKVTRSESKHAVFDRLVNYIDREGTEDAPVRVLQVFADGRQRVQVGDVVCETNAFSYETASAEMNMVAAQNHRIVDPVYHFIISWPEADKPTDAQVFESVQYALKSIGLEGHQYVTAIHRDTENVHAHVAANRVNPMTYKAANMWGDVDTLQKSMRILEHHYGFTQDNGPWQMNADNQLVRPGPHYSSAPQGAAKREIFSNKESLHQYAVNAVRFKIDEVLGNRDASWKRLHLILHESGLGLREQGGGLVIYDYLRPHDQVVKASSVHPSITKVKMEPVYGAYEGPPPFESDDPYEGSYAIYNAYQPMYEARDKGARDERREERAVAREVLKARYQAYRAGWKKPDLNVQGRYQHVAARYQAMKADVRRTYDDPLLRKLMYRVAEFERMKAMAELRIALRQERQALADKGLLRPITYPRWVELEALDGNVAAVSQLRGFAYRETRKRRVLEKDLDRLILASKADDSFVASAGTHTTQLRRNGTVEYLRDGVVGVVDRGGSVVIKPEYYGYDESANFWLAVDIVGNKSGERVKIYGDHSFVDQVLHAGMRLNHQEGEYVFLVTDQYQLERYNAMERRYSPYLDGEAVQEQRRYGVEHNLMDEAVVRPAQYLRP